MSQRSADESSLAEAVRDFLTARKNAQDAMMDWRDDDRHRFQREMEEAEQRMTILAFRP